MNTSGLRYNRMISSILLLIVVYIDIATKAAADFQDLMWACYWAVAAIIAGALLDLESLICAGFLFFFSIGFPAWTIGLLIGRPANPTSVILHTLPILFGPFYFSNAPVPSYRTALFTWLMYVVPALVSWRFCTPDRHINLAHWIWPPVEAVFRTPVAFQLTLVIMTAATPILSISLLRRYKPPRPCAPMAIAMGQRITKSKSVVE